MATAPKMTAEQKAWVKKLGTLVAPGAGSEDKEDVGSATGPSKASDGPITATPDFVPVLLAVGKEVVDTVNKITGGRRVCVVEVVNKTNRTMFQGVPKHQGGGFRKLPPDKIAPGKSAVFVTASSAKIPIPFLEILKEGCIGELPWIGFDLDTTWTIKWKFTVGRATSGERELTGTKAFDYIAVEPEFTTEGDNDVREFRFTLLGGSGPQPKPDPEPGPAPQPGPAPKVDVRSNCVITVQNDTKLPLRLIKQDHVRGDFLTFPAKTVPPGGNTQFVSVESPRAKEQGCKGFLIWEVGSPAVAKWRVDWDNPEEERNTASATIDNDKAGLSSLEQIGQDDENVPVVFTLSGGGAGPEPKPEPEPGPGPEPEPEPGPEPEPEFNPPPGSRQPTLRIKDKSKDGWVEYLQVQLNHHLGTKLKVDGDFGQQTLNAVIAFQKKLKLEKVDGVVGNETWSALREGPREKPGTDGRQPHTFEEKGPEARFDNENIDAVYRKDDDAMFILVASVGDEPIDKFNLHVKVTPPGTKSTVKLFPIGTPREKFPGGGAQHSVKLPNFKKTFPAKDKKAKITDYNLEAFFDKELGDDVFRGKIKEE